MNDQDAVEGLTALGLTTYESRVFIALQKLGMATASEISEVADVPRSQVYGAAAGLEERGLVETQQSRPTRYRPVPLEEARTRLLDRIERVGRETFEFLESVQESHTGGEQSEAIWMVDGTDSIVSRTAELVDDAEEYVVYAADHPDRLEPEILDALATAADEGLAVAIASANPDVHGAATDLDVEVQEIPPERTDDTSGGRILLADHDTMLMSVVSVAPDFGPDEEVAFWSSNTALAAVLVDFLEERLADPFE